jgi:hypothetical protein
MRYYIKPRTAIEWKNAIKLLWVNGITSSGKAEVSKPDSVEDWITNDIESEFAKWPIVTIETAEKRLNGHSGSAEENMMGQYDKLPMAEFWTMDWGTPDTELVTLNEEYDAEVTAEGITVGCQTFTFEAFDKLAEAVKKMRP